MHVHGFRVLCAALLFLAFTLGVPSHAMTGHGWRVGEPVVHLVVVHSGSNCCHEHNGKAASAAICQIACSTTFALLGNPPRIGVQRAHAVQFPPRPPSSDQGLMLALDPFPPRPFRIA